jgi:hypothetical protein
LFCSILLLFWRKKAQNGEKKLGAGKKISRGWEAKNQENKEIPFCRNIY